ncbi:hypothetical protein Cni_G05619 [Canna indica]|uniref:Tetratricopeptide repeat-like superfamily protein n=1 Tax=Canna indica TaxID=4628 RepID=A0AAQ3JY16_9LILI|nr:hypothetical protein Cni_G05619 [Canna indica]
MNLLFITSIEACAVVLCSSLDSRVSPPDHGDRSCCFVVVFLIFLSKLVFVVPLDRCVYPPHKMLLRSASSPLLNSSWVPAGKEATAAHDFLAELFVPPLPRVRSVAHIAPCLSSCSSSSFGSSPVTSSPTSRRRLVTTSTISRALSDGDLSDPKPRSAPARSLSSSLGEGLVREVDEDQVFGKSPHSSSSSSSLGRLLSSSGLDEGGVVVEGCYVAAATLTDGCTGGTGGGGKICGGGGSGSNKGDWGSGLSDSNNGKDVTDAYYLQMIEANPGNSLILGNYAKFLAEVRGDVAKAQEYCERAILANPGDAGVLALYADLVWQSSRDAPRAEGYFDRAVQAAPDDCYIMASYAKFLWDTEEEEETEAATETSNQTSSPFAHAANPPPIAEAS